MDELRSALQNEADTMIRVATGRAMIDDVNNEYIQHRQANHRVLEDLGVQDPNPHPDLWHWWRECRANSQLGTYRERRAHISQLFQPVFEELNRVKAPIDRPLALALQKAIVRQFNQDDWTDFLYLHDEEDIAANDERLLRSLYFGDDDYPHCVLTAVEELLRRGHKSALIERTDLPHWLQDNEPRLFRELFGQEAVALTELGEAGKARGIHEFYEHTERIRKAIDNDPELAIGSAKDLLESVFKAILSEHGNQSTRKLPAQMKSVRQTLELDKGEMGDVRKQTLSGLSQVVEGVAQMRNLYGTGHGRISAHKADQIHARLVVDAVATIGFYLFRLSVDQSRGTDDLPVDKHMSADEFIKSIQSIL